MDPLEDETTMAQGLHATDDSAGYDAACKRVLSEKAILARIMKACLEEYTDCGVNEIAERYIEGQPQVSAVPVLPDEEGSTSAAWTPRINPCTRVPSLTTSAFARNRRGGETEDPAGRLRDIPMTQKLEQEVSVMCNLSKGVMEKSMKKGMEKGRAEGAAENTLASIKNLMETLDLSIEQAMAALKVPEVDRPKYAKQLNG